MDDQELIRVGRSIAQDLDELLGDGADGADGANRAAGAAQAQVAEVRARLEGLLARAQAGEPVRADLVALLAERDELRRAARSRLKEERQYRTFDALPGDPAALSPPRYVCPRGDEEWYRFDAGEAIPRCSVHDVPLAPC